MSPLDTSADIDARMMAKFTSMTISERAATSADLTDMCTKLALAGIKSQHGDLPVEDVRWHLAARRYGERLANDVYGARTL